MQTDRVDVQTDRVDVQTGCVEVHAGHWTGRFRCMPQKLITLPLRAGLGAARLYLDVTTRAVKLAVGVVTGGGSGEPSAQPKPARTRAAPPAWTEPASAPTSRPTPTTSTTPTTRKQTRPEPSSPAPGQGTTSPLSPIVQREPEKVRSNGGPVTPVSPIATDIPPVDFDTEPMTPITSEAQAVKTVDDEPELVAEFAEPGAEDGAGAQLDVEEPWEGYSEMNSGAVLARLGEATPAELAVVELYEQTHKKRQTVLSAAARRLRAVTPPGS